MNYAAQIPMPSDDNPEASIKLLSSAGLLYVSRTKRLFFVTDATHILEFRSAAALNGHLRGLGAQAA